MNSEAIALLQRMIATPSPSREEGAAADIVEEFLQVNSVKAFRKGNNLWCYNSSYDPTKKTILLNSHIDTVKPGSAWMRDPFLPEIDGDKLYGLGSNDAGASVVSLIATFLHFYKSDLKYNLCLALTSEEECSGAGGIESVIPEFGEIDFAIVGEPTGMHLAIAEKGLMVVDCVTEGVAGHAARGEGVNAIYKAIKDIEWFREYRFPKTSPLLGEVMMSVTMINAGSQHNVVPPECRFTVDIRMTEDYTHDQILDVICENVSSTVTPRSKRLGSSSIDLEHPIVKAGVSLGRKVFGSPTMSDQALLRVPSLKMGVGDSARSHTADEYVLISEIEEGIKLYKEILEKIII